MKKIYVGIDRDGTLIEDSGFFGRSDFWKEELRFRPKVIEGLQLFNSYPIIFSSIISNQAGVALEYFDEKRVNEISDEIKKRLFDFKIKLDDFQYCPYVTQSYIKNKIGSRLFNKYIISESDPRIKLRKPNIGMVLRSLEVIGLSLDDIQNIYFIGDKLDDINCGLNCNGKSILVYNGENSELYKQFKSNINRKVFCAKNFLEACEFVIHDSRL